MKKVVNILSIVSVVSVGLLLLLSIIWYGKSVRLTFIFVWVSSVLIAFSIPLIFRSFSLVAKRDKIKPNIWLLVYGSALIVYFLIILNFGFIERTKDLPLAIQENYFLINGVPQVISNSKSAQTVKVEGGEFSIDQNFFYAIEENKLYQFIYLPNSKYVIDVIDENGVSLLKNQR